MAPAKKTNGGRTRKPLNKRWTHPKKKTPSAVAGRTSATPAKKSPPKKYTQLATMCARAAPSETPKKPSQLATMNAAPAKKSPPNKYTQLATMNASSSKKSPPKKSGQLATMRAAAAPRGSNNPTVPLHPLTDGIPVGGELTEIIASSKGVFVCKWFHGPTTLVDRRIMKMEYPQQVMHFYEKQIRSYERNVHVSSDSDSDDD